MSTPLLTNDDVQTRLAEGAQYLDVRSQSEFEHGHVVGAYNVPISFGTLAGLVPNPDFAQVVCAHFDKHHALIVGCHSGARATRAAQLLQRSGFTQVFVHREGWGGSRDAFGRLTPGWEARDLPRDTRAETGHDYASLLGGEHDAGLSG